MSKRCEVCGKSREFGQRIRHHHAVGWLYRAPRTKRAWKPNFRQAVVVKDGIKKKVTVCMSCYKKLYSK